MLSSKVQLQKMNYSSISKTKSEANRILSNAKSADIGQVKIYLGFGYFLLLTVFSVLLLN